MQRTLKYLVVVLLMTAFMAPAYGDTVDARDIFEGMIYYDTDQLTAAGHRDYHCIMTQSVDVDGFEPAPPKEKDVYFMVPMYLLNLDNGQPSFIFHPDALITTMEIQELDKLRDTTIDEVPCFTIKLTPMDRVYRRFPTTHYVAKDDFRKIRTINYSSWENYDSVIKTLDYTYKEVDGMMLLDTIVTVTRDTDDNILHTVTARYTDYEFDLGLDEEFFMRHTDDVSVYPSFN